MKISLLLFFNNRFDYFKFVNNNNEIYKLHIIKISKTHVKVSMPVVVSTYNKLLEDFPTSLIRNKISLNKRVTYKTIQEKQSRIKNEIHN